MAINVFGLAAIIVERNVEVANQAVRPPALDGVQGAAMTAEPQRACEEQGRPEPQKFANNPFANLLKR